MARPIEDEFGQVQQLILLGKERGYLLYDEVNESLPEEQIAVFLTKQDELLNVAKLIFNRSCQVSS